MGCRGYAFNYITLYVCLDSKPLLLLKLIHWRSLLAAAASEKHVTAGCNHRSDAGNWVEIFPSISRANCSLFWVPLTGSTISFD